MPPASGAGRAGDTELGQPWTRRGHGIFHGIPHSFRRDRRRNACSEGEGGGWSRVPLSGPLSGRAPPCGSVPGDALRAGPETAGRAGSRGDETEAALFTHVPENSVPGRKQRAGPATACRAGNRGDETEAALFTRTANTRPAVSRRRARRVHGSGGSTGEGPGFDLVRDSICSPLRFARPFRTCLGPCGPGRKQRAGPGTEATRRKQRAGPGSLSGPCIDGGGAPDHEKIRTREAIEN